MRSQRLESSPWMRSSSSVRHSESAVSLRSHVRHPCAWISPARLSRFLHRLLDRLLTHLRVLEEYQPDMKLLPHWLFQVVAELSTVADWPL